MPKIVAVKWRLGVRALTEEEPIGPAPAGEAALEVPDDRSSRRVLALLCLLLVAAFLLSLSVGRYGIPLPRLFAAFFDPSYARSEAARTIRTVLLQIRVPRVLCALGIGAALSLSGSGYQGIFRNPMVSPDILGAASGAGFGAALAILFSLGPGLVQASAFFGGLTAVLLAYRLGTSFSRGGDNQVLVLVLTGLVVGTLFTAFTSLIKFVADPFSKLPAITFWLMGGLSSVSRDDLARLYIPVTAAAVPLVMVRWRLNLLAFGDEEARSMGLDTGRIRALVILCSTLLTAAAVSVGGLVGWVGLVIPHIARLVAGPNYKGMLPVSILLGALFLLVVDDLARCLFSIEIPLGILTALIGAPFFIYLMAKNKRGLAL